MADKYSTLTKLYLNKIFLYKDGELYWKNSGKKAGHLKNKNYYCVGLNNKEYKIHRIIYIMMFDDSSCLVDHIDNNRLNNRIENLRPTTVLFNNWNAKLKKTNTSGAKGVSWVKRTKSWRVQIRVNGKPKHLGLFKDFELAELVAIEARNKYHKEWANHC